MHNKGEHKTQIEIVKHYVQVCLCKETGSYNIMRWVWPWLNVLLQLSTLEH